MGVNLSLRVKLLILVVTLVLCFGAALAWYVSTRVAGDLNREMLKRGVSIAKHLAELATEDFIESNHLHLQYLARGHQSTEPDIRYILMTDRDGQLIAHSFGTTFPMELAAANRYVAGQEASIQRVDTGSETIYDIAVPVLDGRTGSLRIGISAESISTAVNALIQEILGAILLLGLLALVVTLPVAQAIAHPLSRLTRAIDGLSKGRGVQLLPGGRRDEIGVLNDAFNQMAADVRMAEKRLAAQVNFLQVLMEDLPVPVFYKDHALKMLGCNGAFAAFWGKRPDEIIGRYPEELYSPAEAALHRAKDLETLHGDAALAYEQIVTSADGGRHDVIFYKAPFHDEDGKPAGIIGVMHDVTPQREANRKKNEFVSTVAHEFQTPLATILGFCELLREGIVDGEERIEALQVITGKAERLSQMVDELLDVARLESGHILSIDKERCDLNQLLTDNIDSFRRRIATHQFSLALPTSPLEIEADCKRIGQVVENLISNAVKYSVATSTVHVTAGREGKYCRIVIRDEGVGMSTDQIEHLFDKFYRVSTDRKAPRGTGLGLFIVKSIVEAHQGDIRVDSAPGRGTTVTVSLPVGGEA